MILDNVIWTWTCFTYFRWQDSRFIPVKNTCEAHFMITKFLLYRNVKIEVGLAQLQPSMLLTFLTQLLTFLLLILVLNLDFGIRFVLFLYPFLASFPHLQVFPAIFEPFFEQFLMVLILRRDWSLYNLCVYSNTGLSLQHTE